jgi:hypothetical protein
MWPNQDVHTGIGSHHYEQDVHTGMILEISVELPQEITLFLKITNPGFLYLTHLVKIRHRFLYLKRSVKVHHKFLYLKLNVKSSSWIPVPEMLC